MPTTSHWARTIQFYDIMTCVPICKFNFVNSSVIQTICSELRGVTADALTPVNRWNMTATRWIKHVLLQNSIFLAEELSNKFWMQINTVISSPTPGRVWCVLQIKYACMQGRRWRKSFFLNHDTELILGHFLRIKCSHVYATEPHWWQINIGSGSDQVTSHYLS